LDNKKKYLNLNDLEIYLLSRELSDIVWNVYVNLDWKLQKIVGDQFVRSTDSVGANIAEEYGRFHYLDKIKFYYNARASLKESRHWFELAVKREIINNEIKEKYLEIYAQLSPKLNAFINSSYKNIRNKKS